MSRGLFSVHSFPNRAEIPGRRNYAQCTSITKLYLQCRQAQSQKDGMIHGCQCGSKAPFSGR